MRERRHAVRARGEDRANRGGVEARRTGADVVCRVGARMHERHTGIGALAVDAVAHLAVQLIEDLSRRHRRPTRATLFARTHQPDDARVVVRDDVDRARVRLRRGDAEQRAAVARGSAHRVLRGERREETYVPGREQPRLQCHGFRRREIRIDIEDLAGRVRLDVADAVGIAAVDAVAQIDDAVDAERFPPTYCHASFGQVS